MKRRVVKTNSCLEATSPSIIALYHRFPHLCHFFLQRSHIKFQIAADCGSCRNLKAERDRLSISFSRKSPFPISQRPALPKQPPQIPFISPSNPSPSTPSKNFSYIILYKKEYRPLPIDLEKNRAFFNVFYTIRFFTLNRDKYIEIVTENSHHLDNFAIYLYNMTMLFTEA